MTDLERLGVAWDLWCRRSRAIAVGVRGGPLLIGATAAGVVVGAAALKPLLA